MRQRVMIAMALINNPEVLIADEPTTALDVTTQAQILRLMTKLQEEHQMAIVMITHDLGVVAELSDEVLVMYGGRVVEQASVDDLFTKPEMPYTWGLLGSLPRLDITAARLEQIPGQPPSLLHPPTGCAFNPRCSTAAARSCRSCGAESESSARATVSGVISPMTSAPASGRRRRPHSRRRKGARRDGG